MQSYVGLWRFVQIYRIKVYGVLSMSVNTYGDLWRSIERGDLRSAMEG